MTTHLVKTITEDCPACYVEGYYGESPCIPGHMRAIYTASQKKAERYTREEAEKVANAINGWTVRLKPLSLRTMLCRLKESMRRIHASERAWRMAVEELGRTR